MGATPAPKTWTPAPEREVLSAMFGLLPLPRTLEAAKRDSNHQRRHVRLSVVSDLVRLAALEQADRPTALALLEQMLGRDSDPEIRARAAIGLADCEAGEEQVGALLHATKDVHLSVAEMALAALREVCAQGHPAASSAIEDAVRSDHAPLRFQGVAAASRVLGDAAFARVIELAIADPDAKVRSLAWRVCDERFRAPLPAELEKRAISALRDKSQAVRLAAAILLAPCGDSGAQMILVAALNEGWSIPAPEDEQAVIELVGELNLAAALPGLLRHARGRLGLVPGRFAWQARVAMARLGDVSARVSIETGLRSRRAHVRLASALAVGKARLHGLRAVVEGLAHEGKISTDVLAQVQADLSD